MLEITTEAANVTIIHPDTECESCLVTGEHTPAVRHSANPDWSGYALCEECAQELDARKQF